MVFLHSIFLFLVFVSMPRVARSWSSTSPNRMESLVRQYFEGVNQQDPEMIRRCFGETATIWDVCGINSSRRTVKAKDLVDRCMDFVTAHPDCVVKFHYGPECGRTSGWVVAHWYETGTWTGESCGLVPTNEHMAVEGQTRFLVDETELKIKEFVVTRTYTDWEKTLLEKQQNDSQT
ncbi:predicted protein [Phaeodactylum tricornutum CCAP 1055/1]|uniref:SnoaL-like domain-containing protein n=1 Tax=Phaeodactylum tricornutum (strain CCAP 1055/1) TaxID=556484 RepID=B7G7N1_PHATC|nr:predicted protein [Phaeodactylum tricornutum CCAP 1055/1]EEC45391.1 predicted protein [Phaeodactylum tricornutum CCAP 1055/1]|eukprot:XP_002183173.1 predicted protein [Phaeodactylum tricornutum CCAP 1055/1]